MRAYNDCTVDALGIPDLGKVPVNTNIIMIFNVITIAIMIFNVITIAIMIMIIVDMIRST